MNKCPDELILIGYWQDANGDLPFIHPAKIANYSRSWSEKRRLVRYLRGGVEVCAEMGVSWCRFTQDPSGYYPKMGSTELSDGKFVWPFALSYYVRRFDIELPDWFESDIKSNGYKIDRKSICVEQLEDVDYDLSLWVSWCRLKDATISVDQ